MLDPAAIAELESVVGPLEDGKMTSKQALMWAKYMATETDKEFAAALGDTASQYFAPKYQGHWLANPSVFDEAGENFASAMIARAAHAMKFFLSREQTPGFIDYIKRTRLRGFAGDKCPHHFFPTANSWFEVAFVPGSYPGVVPLRDNTTQAQLRISNLAIHAVCDGAIIPSTGLGHREAQILAFVTDALGVVHTYAGHIQYGSGGAVMYPIKNHQEAIRAYSGLPPVEGMMINAPMSNIGQFICGTLANLIGFYVEDGGELLTASTESTSDAKIEYPS